MASNTLVYDFFANCYYLPKYDEVYVDHGSVEVYR